MKLGKKLLALALAGVLALSVLTGCSGSGSSKVNGNALAKILTVYMHDTVEYDSSLNKTAENAMKAVKKAVSNDTTGMITMENAIDYTDGTLLKEERDEPKFTTAGAELQAALELTDANNGKCVSVALVDEKYLKGDNSALVFLIGDAIVMAQDGSDDYYRMGLYESGDYMLVVFVGEKEASASTVAPPAP